MRFVRTRACSSLPLKQFTSINCASSPLPQLWVTPRPFVQNIVTRQHFCSSKETVDSSSMQAKLMSRSKLEFETVRSSNYSRIGALSNNIDCYDALAISLDPLRFNGALHSWKLGDVTFQLLELHSPSVIMAKLQPGYLGVGMILDNEKATILNGFYVNDKAIWTGLGRETAVLKSIASVRIALISWHEAAPTFLKIPFARAQLPRLSQERPFGVLLKTSSDSIHTNQIRYVIDQMSVDPHRMSDRRIVQILDKLGRIMTTAMTSLDNQGFDAAISGRYLDVFCSALEYLFGAPNLQHIRPKCLGEAVGVGPQKLRDVVRAVCDMTPKRFSRLVQLHQIREFLLADEGRRPQLVEVANLAGFSSPSHFSSSYASTFGGPPSTEIKVQTEE